MDTCRRPERVAWAPERTPAGQPSPARPFVRMNVSHGAFRAVEEGSAMKSSHKSVRLLGTLLLLPALTVMAEEGKAPATGDVPPAGLVRANAEFVCFFMSEVGGQPKPKNCEEEAARELTQVYPSLPEEQRQQLAQIQGFWPTFRQEWQSLDEPQKAALRAQWAEVLREQEAQQGTGGSEPPPAK
jgi:hypothetical protein